MWELQAYLWHACTHTEMHLFSSCVFVFHCLTWICSIVAPKVSSWTNFPVLWNFFHISQSMWSGRLKVSQSLNSFLLSPSVHEMWTAGDVRYLPNPENYQNSDQIPGWKEKCCWTTVSTGSRGGGTKWDRVYILLFFSETVPISVA